MIKTYPARISEQARDYFIKEISRRKLARQKPDTVMRLIDEFVQAEQARRAALASQEAEWQRVSK